MDAFRVPIFDVWQAGYGGEAVLIARAGTKTRAGIFFDEGLTEPAPNPQMLDRHMYKGVAYGKFRTPLYCGEPIVIIVPAPPDDQLEEPTAAPPPGPR